MDSCASGLERPWYELAFTKKRKRFEAPVPLAPIWDTHAHLLGRHASEPALAIARAALAGVGGITCMAEPLADALDLPGAEGESFATRCCRELDAWERGSAALLAEAAVSGIVPPAVAEPHASALPGHVTMLVGVHPYGAADFGDAQEQDMRELLEDRRCVGIGEIGLDYHFDDDDEIAPAPHGVQIACMERQLAMACEFDVPVELHLRHAADDERRTSHEDALAVLDNIGVPAAGCVLHCFGEDRGTMERFIERGCFVAFGGAATFKRNEQVREAFTACPTERMLLETDCPYMAPEPLRGLVCEPAMTTFTVEALVSCRAAITGEEPVQLARTLWDNAVRLLAPRR